MKTIWVVQYKDGSADVYDTETSAPAWPYVDAFDAEDEIKALRAELAESERHRQILTHQNMELKVRMDFVATELEKGTQQLLALWEMKSPDEWGSYALRNGKLHIQCLIAQRARKEAEEENARKDKRIAALIDRAATYHGETLKQRGTIFGESKFSESLCTDLRTEIEILKADLSSSPQERKICVGCALPGENARLRELVTNLIDGDPNETIADNGATVLDLWRYHARAALKTPEAPANVCPMCGSAKPFQHMHDIPHGIREMHMAGTERFVCQDCQHVLTRDEAEKAGCVYVFDK